MEPLLNPLLSVIVVGNGPSIMHQQNGKLIDCFNEVVRFNECRTLGMEAHTGRKTTIWCTFGRGMLPGDIHIRPEKVIMVHQKGKAAYKPENLYTIAHAFYEQITEEVRKRSKLKNADKIIPSSGYLVLRWLFEVHQVKVIHVTGFDHFKKDLDRRHHYWNPKAFARPQEHDGDAEARELEKYIIKKRLFYLNQ